MATSSITHNFTISTQKGVEQFISAVEASEKDKRDNKMITSGVLLTSPQDIQLLMKRRAKNVQ